MSDDLQESLSGTEQDALQDQTEQISGTAPLVVTPPTVLTQDRFVSMTGIVIDNFESGYYHPDMMAHYNAHDRALLANSGETMFGLDRKAGAALSVYPEWAKFWAIIDAADARHKWAHYYTGGTLNAPLKDLASKIMYAWFSHLAMRHFQGTDIDRVAADDRLVIHFSYSAWNGEKWFIIFSQALHTATGSKDEIFNTAINARLNANSIAIRNTGVKMMSLFRSMHLV